MKKLFVLLAALALASCNLAQGPGAVKPPTHVALTGAKGLFLQTGTASKSMATARDVTNGPQLMKVNTDLSVGPATFTASDGSTVSVTITATRQVSAQYLLIAYSYSGGSQTAAADMTSGTMAPLAQAPNYFAQVRMLGSAAYFTSGGSLYHADLSSGTETAIGSGLAGNEYLHVTPAGDVYAYGAQGWIFPAAGGSSTFGNTTQVPTYGSSSVEGNTSVIEDQSTGDMWYISISAGGGTAVSKFVFTASNGYPGTPIQISTTVWGVNVRLGQQVYFQGAIFLGPATAFAFVSDGSGGLTLTTWDTSAVPQNLTNGLPGYFHWQTDGSNIYSAPCVSSNTINQVPLPPGGGAVVDPVLVNGTTTISSFAVVGGQVIYSDATGTYQQAATVGATATLYSGTPVSVAPVP